ncbi:endophilin-B2 isoform X5 [Nycticebus coucang]|uniref:endophilin-B2 isoform X5 n=1 Tax=Nycticebus coucang TaxID=9470 RepID=UPI00234DE998|nr:endophilin-B2 isoform X5 [Nycticebus coucang]
MDFNMKKLASDAGIFFTRAVQFTEEKFGQAEKTELDAHFENLLARADSTKNWTEKILRQTEVLLQPNPRKTLIKVSEAEKRLGAAERDFIHMASVNFLTPLRNFLEGDWKTISKERRLLQNRRLDLDACKARLKRAKAAEAKATTVPDFQETRPRNYILSASASSLWNDEVDKAEQELRVAQTEFDRQAEVTRLLLEGISSTHVNHLRCLHEFVKSQTTYYAQCYRHMLDLQKQLGSSQGAIFPGTFVGTTEPGSPPLSSTSPTTTAATMPVVASVASLAPPGEAALCLEDVAPPASGTRKARVLYDYEAADSSELALLADELITVYSLPGMDPDWLIGERGNKKGKVPVTYLELLS